MHIGAAASLARHLRSSRMIHADLAQLAGRLARATVRPGLLACDAIRMLNKRSRIELFDLMKRRVAAWLGAGLIVLAAGTVIGGGLYDRYGRWSAERVVTRALEDFTRHERPHDVTLALDVPDPTRVAAALQVGFEVEILDNILWSYRSFEVSVRVSDGSSLHCDLYHTPQWKLTCRQ